MARHAGAAFDRDGALARSGQVDAGGAGSTAGRSVLRTARRRNRWTGWTSPPRSPRADLSAVAGRWRRDAGRVHRRGGRRRAASRAAATLAGDRRRAAQSGDHDGAARPARRAGRSGRALGWDGDALEAQCFGFLAARTRAGCRSASPAPPGARPQAADHGGRLADRDPPLPRRLFSSVRRQRHLPAGDRLAAVVFDRLGHPSACSANTWSAPANTR